MSSKPSVKLRDIDKDPLIEEALYLADYMYEKAGTPEFQDDERWRLSRELKDVSVFVVTETAMAVGNDGLAGTEFLWGNVRKQISRLRAVYRFAGKQGFLQIDPEVMVRIDKFIQQVSDQVQEAYDRTEAASEKELNVWAKKHKLWKEIGKNDDKTK
jgi:hypothetical protein